MTSEPSELLLEVTCDSGEIAIVEPLSPFAYQALVREAERLYPMPNKDDYVKPLEGAPIEGLTVGAEHNEEYVKATRKAIQSFKNWLFVAVLDAGVVIDTVEGREVTMARYAARLKALAERGVSIEDEWLATVKFGVIRTPADTDRIVNAARGGLSQEEIDGAVRSFRRSIQRCADSGDTAAQAASSAAGSTRQTA